MLYLTRKIDETIIINNNIEITIVEIKGKSVKIGCSFPKTATVLRKELYDKIMTENLAASGSIVNEDNVSSLIEMVNEKITKKSDE